MICLYCQKEFGGRSDAKFCSSACRVYHSRGTPVTDNCVTDKLEKVVTDKCLDLVKDLKLDLHKDLGITAWTENGIFIRPDITERQVRAIRDIVAAKNGWTERTFVPARRV